MTTAANRVLVDTNVLVYASLRRKLPGYPLPVLRLARLAVDATAQNRGVGKSLLRHVFLLTLKMSLKGAQFDKAEAVEQIVRNGVEMLKAIPGVVQASATCCVPLEGGYGLPFIIAGKPLKDAPSHGGGGWLTVSPGCARLQSGRRSMPTMRNRGAPRFRPWFNVQAAR